jgi:hypothetical protein
MTVAVLAALLPTISGCLFGAETLKVEYLPEIMAPRLVHHEPAPTIAVNPLYDDRIKADKVGEGYNMYGAAVDTFVADRSVTGVIEDAIVRQLTGMGFKVVRTSGWDLTAQGISEYVNADMLLGGRLKVMWVESRPGLFTVSVSATSRFLIVLADVREKKILWSGEFEGSERSEEVVRTVGSMEAALNRAMSKTVDSLVRDETFCRALTVVRVRF